MKRADMTDVTAPPLVATRDSAPPAVRLGDVYGRSLKMFAAHWLAYCGMMALGYAPIAIFMSGLAANIIPEMEGHTFASALPVFIVIAALGFCLLLAPAAIALAVVQDISGRGFSFGQSVRIALRRSPAILALTLLIVLFGMVGMVLLIVPGVIVFCIYSVAIPACIIEGLGPIKSMSRSAFLTKGNRWRISGILCELYIGGIAIEQLARFILHRITSDIATLAISMTLDIVVGAFTALALGVLYAQLRIAREGVDIEHVAKVFD
jgi:uncharacterized membrane protein